MLPLFRHFPQIKDQIPWISLGSFPTQVYQLTHITKCLPIQSFWLKRDDQSASLYGGNKVRPLEFEYGKVIQLKKELVIAYGSIGSNFTLACCLFGKELNIPVHLILFNTVTTDSTNTNYELNCKLADKVTISKSPFYLPYYILAEKRAHHKMNSYIMPPGGTSPLSILGYVNAMFELKEQIDKGEIPMPDYMFLSVGSGGTLVGLLIGKVLLGLPIKIIGIVVVNKIVTNSYMIKLLIYRTVRLFNRVTGSSLKVGDVFKELHLDYRFLGKGYAYPTEEGGKAISLLKDEEAIILDETYTGKGMAGTLDYIKYHLKPEDHVLFWHSYNSREILIQ